jgi:quinol monooxygenase YgiN
MIFITAKMRVLPEYADRFPEIVDGFTRSSRTEPGCLWFEWFRGIDDPSEYVLIEAFRDELAGAAHVQSEHFKTAINTLPRYLRETPKIVNVNVAQDDWSLLQELAVES